MSCFPDYGKAPPDYMVAFMDCLTWLSPEELGWITNPRSGLMTVCKFLPTPADVHEFIRNKRQQAEQFTSHPTSGYARFKDEAVDVAPLERRKAQVLKVLGYDPQRKSQPVPRGPVVEPTAADLEQVRAKSKIPDAPFSEPFKQWLRNTNYADTLASQGKPIPVWMQVDA